MTRTQAKAAGLKVYTGGKKCRKHPNSPRRVKNGNCHQCIVLRMRRTSRLKAAEKKRQQRAVTRGAVQ